jgi:hypothetical protein
MELVFSGLTMPVFTAFGWAGEETAMKFAFSQLQLFVQALHRDLPREMQAYFPHMGVDTEAQCAYLARNQDIESDLYITFHTRPVAFRIDVNLTSRAALIPAFKRLQEDTAQFHRALTALDPEWTVRLQQMEYDAETDQSSHYKDVFKGSIPELSMDNTADIVMRADYLNGEKDRWLAPLYLSRSIASEFIASMGAAVIGEMVKEIDSLRPVMFALSKPTGRILPKPVKKPRPVKVSEAASVAAADESVTETVKDRFSYTATLKTLHLRKGFINMTPAEWPFFAINARTTTRQVTVFFDNQSDAESNVWRLSPTDQARLMLGRKGQRWLRDHFASDDKLTLVVTKHMDNSVEIALEPIPVE